MNTVRISQECWQMILGTLLGDAWLPKLEKRKNCYLGVCHSLKQEEYLLHKFKILKELGAEKIADRQYVRDGKVFKAKEFCTKVHEKLTLLRHKLYPHGKKTINRAYLDLLDDRSVAYWFMDDGSLVWHKRKRLQGNIYSTCEFYLAVNCFSINEIEVVKQWFKDKYQIESKIRYHSTSKSFYLIINRHYYQQLVEKIDQYIIPSMKYKTDFSRLGKLVETLPNPTENSEE